MEDGGGRKVSAAESCSFSTCRICSSPTAAVKRSLQSLGLTPAGMDLFGFLHVGLNLWSLGCICPFAGKSRLLEVSEAFYNPEL